ncbi:MAG: ArsA family ATPase [Proteobacteria bacterium]|jgi:anion-transporting  ArsA/GET3 family ATPase|nr:ArsA family ATPase [Pseudomonadota bacterium]
MDLNALNLNKWLSKTRLVVCVGSGGAGKTTTAASIGLWGALQGRKAMVLTIDPAKRLANSLGLKKFGNEETRIDLSPLDSDTDGELWAMMLDSRRTWDGLIIRGAPNEETRDRILNSHIYRHMADMFAGSQDYMATEKLFDLVTAEKYDLVVLDTPPVKNALDFLESPGRMINFLDEKVLKWYLLPFAKAKVGKRFMLGTQAFVYRLLAYIFGKEFLEDLGLFFQEFQSLYAGFRERHDAVVRLFRADDTGFLTICAPTESSIDVAVFFQEELKEREIPRAGVVTNQVHTCSGSFHDAFAILKEEADKAGTDLPPTVVSAVLARLGMAHRRLLQLATAEEKMTKAIRKAAKGGGFYAEIPRLEQQVHDLLSLRQVAENLFNRPGESL